VSFFAFCDSAATDSPCSFHRTLYMRILDHLSKGKAWETALAICKELQHEYETRSFNYTRLAELLVLQSELYGSIVKSDRHFG
jgi:dedicator of cytokinesis protein 3